MKKCFQKKTFALFLKCFKKTLKVFWISIYYSPFWYQKKTKNKKTVFVGLSGGVDSAVSALLLKKGNYQVVGVFMKVYQPEVTTFCWRNELLDALKVSQELKIPFLFFNLEKEYKKNIFDYMINSYQQGLTPNPDVFCNKYIKFGTFMDKSLKLGADFVAMGHYARKIFITEKEKFYLKTGLDNNKDQSYFLSSLSQKQLSKALFPIGELTKEQVREIAQKNNLFNAHKKDSQGLCFVGKVDMREFLQKYIKIKKGAVKNTAGEIIGEHQGVFFYNIGSRHGFKIFPKFKSPNMPRYFILEKKIQQNILIVGPENEFKNFLDKTEILITNINWISGEPDFNKNYLGMIRYRGKKIPAQLFKQEKNKILVKFSEPQRAVSAGQVLVIYDDDICLGEGVIL